MGRSTLCLFWAWNYLCLITLRSSTIHLLHCLSWQVTMVSSLSCVFQAEKIPLYLITPCIETGMQLSLSLSSSSVSFLVLLYLCWEGWDWSGIQDLLKIFFFFQFDSIFCLLFTYFLVIPSCSVCFIDCCWVLSWWSVPYFLSRQQRVQRLSLTMYRYDLGLNVWI